MKEPMRKTSPEGISKLRSYFWKKRWVRASGNTIRDSFKLFLFRLSPVLLAKYLYRTLMGKPLLLKNPQTFDEKLFWIMLNWRHPLKTKCADKYGMREYATEKGYGHLLPELLGVYEKSKDIDFDVLPDRFVLKCTHGCGFNIFCEDKSSLDKAETGRLLDRWLKIDYSGKYGEIHYSGIRPLIICEPFLLDSIRSLPLDYKIHCFNGKAYFTTVCSERQLDGGGTKYDHYDLAWENLLPFSKSGLRLERRVL